MRPAHLVLLALLVAPAVQAQTRLSFAPQVGFYIPTEKLQSIATTGTVDSMRTVG